METFPLILYSSVPVTAPFCPPPEMIHSSFVPLSPNPGTAQCLLTSAERCREKHSISGTVKGSLLVLLNYTRVVEKHFITLLRWLTSATAAVAPVLAINRIVL